LKEHKDKPKKSETSHQIIDDMFKNLKVYSDIAGVKVRDWEETSKSHVEKVDTLKRQKNYV